MEHFLSMGGYGPYIWSAYGFGAVVALWNIWSALHLQRDALERARRRLAMGRSEENDHGTR